MAVNSTHLKLLRSSDVAHRTKGDGSMNKMVATHIAALLVLVATALALPVAAAPREVEGVVFSWNNMGLMGPGHERAQYISVTRASSVVQHNIEFHEGNIVQKTVLYQTDDAARFRLLDFLGRAAERWVPYYGEQVIGGSSWMVVVHYTGYTESREFKGRGRTPPHADEIKRLLLGLAAFETPPQMF